MCALCHPAILFIFVIYLNIFLLYISYLFFHICFCCLQADSGITFCHLSVYPSVCLSTCVSVTLTFVGLLKQATHMLHPALVLDSTLCIVFALCDYMYFLVTLHIVTCLQVEVGHVYELVITNASGLYRYRFGDVIKVVGLHNTCPVVEFQYRYDLQLSFKTSINCMLYKQDDFT